MLISYWAAWFNSLIMNVSRMWTFLLWCCQLNGKMSQWGSMEIMQIFNTITRNEEKVFIQLRLTLWTRHERLMKSETSEEFSVLIFRLQVFVLSLGCCYGSWKCLLSLIVVPTSQTLDKQFQQEDFSFSINLRPLLIKRRPL